LDAAAALTDARLPAHRDAERPAPLDGSAERAAVADHRVADATSALTDAPSRDDSLPVLPDVRVAAVVAAVE
jgi:hypothetical protein